MGKIICTYRAIAHIGTDLCPVVIVEKRGLDHIVDVRVEYTAGGQRVMLPLRGSTQHCYREFDSVITRDPLSAAKAYAAKLLAGLRMSDKGVVTIGGRRVNA